MWWGARAVLVPGVLALLPEYAGLEDPVADLRAACERAVAWLGADGPSGAGHGAGPAGGAEHLLASRRSRAGRARRRVATSSSATARPSAPRRRPATSTSGRRAFDAALGDGARARARWPTSTCRLSGELWADTDAIAAARPRCCRPGCPATDRLRRRPVRRAVLGGQVGVVRVLRRAPRRRPPTTSPTISPSSTRRPRDPWLRVNMVEHGRRRRDRRVRAQRLDQQRGRPRSSSTTCARTPTRSWSARAPRGRGLRAGRQCRWSW